MYAILSVMLLLHCHKADGYRGWLLRMVDLDGSPLATL